MNWRILGIALALTVGVVALSGCAKDDTGADESVTTKANVNNSSEAAKSAGAAPPNPDMEFPHPGKMKKGGAPGGGNDPGQMPSGATGSADPGGSGDPSAPR